MTPIGGSHGKAHQTTEVLSRASGVAWPFAAVMLPSGKRHQIGCLGVLARAKYGRLLGAFHAGLRRGGVRPAEGGLMRTLLIAAVGSMLLTGSGRADPSCPSSVTLDALVECIRDHMPRADSNGYVAPTPSQRADWRIV